MGTFFTRLRDRHTVPRTHNVKKCPGFFGMFRGCARMGLGNALYRRILLISHTDYTHSTLAGTPGPAKAHTRHGPWTMCVHSPTGFMEDKGLGVLAAPSSLAAATRARG